MSPTRDVVLDAHGTEVRYQQPTRPQIHGLLSISTHGEISVAAGDPFTLVAHLDTANQQALLREIAWGLGFPRDTDPWAVLDRRAVVAASERRSCSVSERRARDLLHMIATGIIRPPHPETGNLLVRLLNFVVDGTDRPLTAGDNGRASAAKPVDYRARD